jgi:hypothetical protein
LDIAKPISIYEKQKSRGEKGPRRLLYLHQLNCLAGQEVETGAQFISQLAWCQYPPQ